MLKHIQKYNRQILVVVSSLLLVVFLAPSAVTQCSRFNAQPSTVYAVTADGASLTLGDLQDLRGELAVLELLGDSISKGLGVDKKPEHWWLLVKEARDAGMVGGMADGRATLDAIAARQGVSGDQLLGSLAASARTQPQAVLQTLANLRGVERLVRMAMGSGRMPAARAPLGARELLTDVSCDVVPIDANAVGDAVQVAPPTADQLAATYEKGKSSLPGSGPGGIGYKFPDRFRVEWLLVPAGAITRSLESDPSLGAVELRKEFRRNPAAYGVAAADLAPEKPLPSFEAHAPAVRAAVEGRLSKERADRIAAAVREWSRMALKDVPVDAGIAKLPADWKDKAPALGALRGELASKFSLQLPEPQAAGDAWLTVADISGNPFLGRATSDEFGQAMPISQMVAELRDVKPDGRLALQSGVVGPVSRTPSGDLVIWRVTEAQASHEPGSMAEVVDAVTKDATAQARYDALAAKVDAIAEMARKDGLDSVAKAYGSAVQPAPGVHLADPAVLRQYRMRFPGSMPLAGQDVDAIRAVVAKAVSLPSEPPVTAQPEADRIVVAAVPSKLAVIVARVNEVRPLTAEDFASMEQAGALSSTLMQDEPRMDPTKAFGFEAVSKRTGFTLKNPDGPDRAMSPDAPAF